MGDRKLPLKEVPETVTNQRDGTVYQRGRFLGKGGFARCYELIDTKANRVFAGKIVAKVLLQKKHQKDKMAQEVEIHKGLSHPHVVRLDGFFEDNDNVYILLELCARRSLMELHKRRKAVTEPEARYFTSQVVVACEYLHGKRIIHRDLKLGNLFLNEEMVVKIGDFGLATTVDFDGEKKKTLCGTPNYIAPEMLGKKGHSYEVDIWAIGCIMFTLLVGKPPFETHSLKETYHKIRNNDYVIPSRVSADAANLIELLLADDPSKRPTIQEVRKAPFFTRGFLPSRLPTSCLTMAPKFTSVNMSTCESDRRALTELGQQSMSPLKRDTVASPLRPLAPIVESQAMGQRVPAEAEGNLSLVNVPSDCYLSDLHSQLNLLISKKPAERDHIQEEEAEDPAAIPVFWVSKWVDYSDKYGLGYELCDNSLGVVFNDNTKMVMDAAGEQFQYIDRENKEIFFTVNEHPRDLQKKVTLLSYFRNYMQEHLQKTGGNMVREGDELARLPVLRTWFRTRSAIVLHLSNGTMQINFFQDHTKLIVCPLMSAATYIDRHRKFRVFKFDLIEKFGCSRDVYARLKYARSMVERLTAEPAHARPGALSTVAIPGGNFSQIPRPNFP